MRYILPINTVVLGQYIHSTLVISQNTTGMTNLMILCTIKWEKANWSGHIMRTNRLPKHVIAENIDGTRRGRRRKQLLDNIKERDN